MKNFCILIAFVFAWLGSNGQNYSGPIAKPTSGYGADGSHGVDSLSFVNPNFLTHDIIIYYPSGITNPVPTLFYSHAFGGNDPANISGFLHFVAQKGYAVVFVPYQTVGVTVTERYTNLKQGFIKAARNHSNIIDTTKVGFVGHSFGGGAVFANAYYCFDTLNWGQNGRFIFSMAQWYTYNITQAQLQSFPSDVKLLSIVYENDSTNDQRMTNDVFNNISIPASDKDYLLVRSDTINGYIYNANHLVPNNFNFDALDYYAYYRLLDAMCDYVFNGNIAGKNVALGHGNSDQVAMPAGMKSLVQSGTPTFAKPKKTFLYPCDSSLNPRQSFCDQNVAIIRNLPQDQITISPNPTTSSITINSDVALRTVEIINAQGQLILSSTSKLINLEKLPQGLYLVKVSFCNGNLSIHKLLKE